MFERFAREDRTLLVFATQEAADLGHRRLGNDHLVLGMLCNARTPIFTLLGENGLKLDTARAAAAAYHDEHADDVDADVEESAAARYEEDREALRSIGIDLDKVRAAVHDRFGDDLSEGWGHRLGPRPGPRRGGRDCGPEGRAARGRGRGHGRSGHGRGRGRGFGPEGFGPEEFGPGGPGSWGDRGEGPWEQGRGRRGPRGRGTKPRFASDTRDALGKAVEIARERGDRQLRPEYLLLGIIEVADDASTAVLASGTASIDDLKAAVLASLPDIEVEA